MRQYGGYISTSRASNISLDIFTQADRYVAKWLDTEAGLVLSSGFVACQIFLKVLLTAPHEICYAPGIHPANWRNEADDQKGDLQAWTQQFVTRYRRNPLQPLVLFYRPIDPLHLRPVSMNWLYDIPKNNRLTLVLDDSHLLGLVGLRGNGTSSLLNGSKKYAHIESVIIGSLSKGMGLPAGFIASKKHWVEEIQRSPFYLGASMPSAAAMYLLLHGEPYYKVLRLRLQSHITRFTEHLRKGEILEHFDYLPNYPIFLCKNPKIYAYLLRKGICVAHFPYPKPKNEPLTRIVLQAAHREEDIDALASHLVACFTEQKR